MNPVDEAEARFAAIVARVRLPIVGDCAALLDVLVRAGAARLVADGAIDRLGEAEDNLRTLMADMTQQSRILRFDAIHEPNLASALQRLCPLWPFC